MLNLKVLQKKLQRVDQKTALIYSTLAVIVLVGLFLRINDFSNRIYIGNEQGRDFFISLVAAQELQLPMTGPWSSIGPITTGPWYWYYLILMRHLIPHMLSPWIATTIASLLTIPIMYKIGSLIYDRYFGLILAALAAFSITLIEASIYLTNPYLLGFTSSLTVLCFLLSFRSKRMIYPALTGLLVGIDLQIHYQALMLVVLLFGFFLLPSQKIKAFAYSLLGLFISAIPMGFFELNNHYFNIWHMADFYFNVSETFYTPRRWLTFTTNTFPKLWGDVTGGGLLIGRLGMVLSGVTLAFLWWKKKLNKESVILIIVFAIQIISIRYWVGEIYVARIQYLIPWILLFTGAVLYTAIRIHKLLIVLLPLYILLIWSSVSSYVFSPNKDLVRIRQELQQIQQRYPNEKFSIYYCEVDRISRDMKDNYFMTMYMENMYSENGRKIAIWRKRNIPIVDEECGTPTNIVPVITSVWDINDDENDALTKKGWKEESPTNLYNRSVKWWYDEKP